MSYGHGAAVSAALTFWARGTLAMERAQVGATGSCWCWNDAHDCMLPSGHAGDHACGGCGDVWNSSAFDVEECGDPFFLDQRTERRCMP